MEQQKTMSHSFPDELCEAQLSEPRLLRSKNTTSVTNTDLPTHCVDNGLDNYSPPLQTGFAGQAWHPTAQTAAQADCQVRQVKCCPQNVAHTYGYDQFLKKGYTGKGLTINLVEIDGYPQADVANYGACVGYKGNITVKTIGSTPSQPGGETALDFEMIEGLAPDVNIVDYQTGDTTKRYTSKS